ncbi:MAG: hypothetical protein ACC662_05765, partial [Planctomycetota bacterium]
FAGALVAAALLAAATFAAPPPPAAPNAPVSKAPVSKAPVSKAPVPLGDAYRLLGRVQTPTVREISGLTAMGTTTDSRPTLLAVTDEGPYDRKTHTVDGTLFVITLRVDPKEGVALESVRPVTLAVTFDRFDPDWPGPVSPMDLESIAPLPGAEGLYLLGGERNPEDQTDDGANRLYVVRYPAGSADRAEVVYRARLFDLPDDATNDRFEGVAALPAPAQPNDTGRAWDVFAFKERTAVEGHTPGYVHGRLVERSATFTLTVDGDRGYPPLVPFFLSRDPLRLSTQADACVAPDGRLWILDRWRRQIHVARPRRGSPPLELQATLDFDDLVKDVPGEREEEGPAPPGLAARTGYGRHEAICFDGRGRLYLATDRGRRSPSTITVLAPRTRRRAPDPR